MGAVEWWGVEGGRLVLLGDFFWKVVARLFRGFLSPLACPDLIRRESTALRNVPGEGGRLFPRRGPWVLEGTREVRREDARSGGRQRPLPLPGRRRRGQPDPRVCTARAVKRGGRAGGRGGGARGGGGLAPERRGVGAIKMHPMELPMEKDGTEPRRPQEVGKAEEDSREAAAAAGK